MTLSALKPHAPKTHVQHELVSVDSLSIDSRIQRREGVKAARVEKMVATFNPNALGAITVSRRHDGHLIVVDGAHRCETVRILGYAEPLHALVYDGLTLAQEAAMFGLLNTFQAPSAISRLLTSVVAGDHDSTEIVRIVEDHGWRWAMNGDEGTFSAVQSAERVYHSAVGVLPVDAYPEVLDRTIGLITTAWHHDRQGVHQVIVMGAGQLFGRFGDAVDVTKLSTALSKERPYFVFSLAKAMHAAQGGTMAAACAKVLVGIHNKGRRVNLLPEWVWTR